MTIENPEMGNSLLETDFPLWELQKSQVIRFLLSADCKLFIEDLVSKLHLRKLVPDLNLLVKTSLCLDTCR
jgi:hypothetical protein